MKYKTVMAIGCHNDDIELRCGGTFAKFADEGAKTHYVLMRNIEQPEAVRILGATDSCSLGYGGGFWGNGDKDPTNQLRPLYSRENTEGMLDKIKALILEKAPDLVLTHHIDDHHIDHYTMSKCVQRAVRSLSTEGKFNGELWFWEPGGVGGNLLFVPNLAVDVTPWMERKQKALKCYVRQVQLAPVLLQQIWKRGRRWGNLFGCEFAEPFIVVTADQLSGSSRLRFDDTSWEQPEAFERRCGVKCPDIARFVTPDQKAQEWRP